MPDHHRRLAITWTAVETRLEDSHHEAPQQKPHPRLRALIAAWLRARSFRSDRERSIPFRDTSTAFDPSRGASGMARRGHAGRGGRSWSFGSLVVARAGQREPELRAERGRAHA